MIRFISDHLSGESWYSTQSTAYALLAVSEFLGGGDKTSHDISYDFHFGNEKTQHAATRFPLSEIRKTFGGKEQESVELTNRSKGTLFVRLSLAGTPLPGQEKASARNLQMQIEYRAMDGSTVNIARLGQGQDFMAIITVTNPGSLGHYENLALTQIFPPGWEIQNARLFGSKIGDFDNPDYQDIRDDRIYRYFNLTSHQTKHFAVKLTAAYKGKYYSALGLL